MKSVAVIGSGIAGMTSAHLLSQAYDVTVFEKNDYIGGHTATIDVSVDGKSYAIDTGFIVFNDRTYPLFEKLLAKLGINRQATEMSFSVKNSQTGLEYNGHSLATLFAQKRNLFKPRFWRFLKEIVRFNTVCKTLHAQGDIDASYTLGDLLDKEGFSVFFRRHYILAMGAAIWSSSLDEMSAFPVRFFVQFFYNHGLLDINNRPQWYVIPGGSREYIAPLTAPYKDRIQLNADIAKVERDEQGVDIVMANGERKRFDKVVFACHSDQALALLANPTQKEQSILGAMPYTANSVVLHTDSSLLPKRKAAWASWNYLLSDDDNKKASLTYSMNILQGIDAKTQFCVTLNNDAMIDQDKILASFNYHHPVFNRESIQAQQRRDELLGDQHSYFCGAYWYNGFHEDGVRSAVDVAKALGVDFE